MSTPISQLPPSQPIANDPVLVQQILREVNPPQQQQGNLPMLPQQQVNYPNQLQNPSSYALPQYKRVSTEPLDYMSMAKKIIIVACLVFVSQITPVKESIKEYMSNDLSLIVRSLIAGISYVGLDMVF